MPLIKRFEDLETWQAGRELTQLIYSVTDRRPFSRDFGLVDQVRRAAVSVMNNIVEGFDSGSTAEFVKFLGYARRSASEVQSCLYVALDHAYLSQEAFQQTYAKAGEVRNLIGGFIRYLRNGRSLAHMHLGT